MKKEEIEKLLVQLNKHIPGELEFLVERTEHGAMEKTRELVVRRFVPYQRLILLDGGHIAQALCRFASELNFAVTVVDDRPSFANSTLFPGAEKVVCDGFCHALENLDITSADYVAVLTRGHRWDRECLKIILKGNMPSYLGLVGSRRRVSGLFDLLEEQGLSRERMDQIATPIGLDIHAVTPQEIAIAILAELIAHRNQKPEDSNVLAQKNTDFSLLLDLMKDEPRAIALVIGTKGSVPVDSGAMMAVNELGRTEGTVGGGCGEFEIIARAREVLKTGVAELVHVDMTADVAEEEGMVCGGTMEVWIEVCE